MEQKNKKKTHRGATLIALLAVVAALASASAVGYELGFGFQTDASWAEGV